jgi:hypothetical protein
MSDVRASVWIGCGAACAAALALIGRSLAPDDAGTRVASDPGPSRSARARVWPPQLPAPAPAPARRPAVPAPEPREILRDLWDAEDAAARFVLDHGLDGGLEIPEPPRLEGESHDAHRRRAEGLRRRALADALLSHVRMRDYFMSSELPPGGMLSRENVRVFRRLPRAGPLERLAALRTATSRMDAAFGPDAGGLAPETDSL